MSAILVPARARRPRWDAWTREECDYLERHAGRVEVAVLAEQLSALAGHRRTENAVRVRADRLGVSLWSRGWSLRGVEALFGISHRTIVRHWVRPGHLPGRRWEARGPFDGWWFEEADVESFVRSYPWLYDWRKMRTGERLSLLAETVHRADPWLSYEDLRRYLGIALVNLDRWRRRGLVPHRRRPRGGPGGGLILVRARDFAAIREAIAAARVVARHGPRKRGNRRQEVLPL